EPNIMIKSRDFRQPEVVVIDFGVCRAMVTAPNGMPGGTPGYMPPETIQQRKWLPRGDVFCLGVTFIQVLLDKSPPTGPRTTATPGGIFVEGCQTIQDIFNATIT
ncbi:BRI1, partial [Symbiodinium sp. KB8]